MLARLVKWVSKTAIHHSVCWYQARQNHPVIGSNIYTVFLSRLKSQHDGQGIDDANDNGPIRRCISRILRHGQRGSSGGWCVEPLPLL